MRNNITAYKHPTIVRKIRQALWLAKLEAVREYKNGKFPYHAKRYVTNRHGHNIMRVSFFIDFDGRYMQVYGDQSRNITDMIVEALGAQ